jgi:hypothetical protein
VERPTSDPPRLVPGDDRELVRQCELWPPHTAISRGTVHKHKRRPFANVLVGDREPVRTNELHGPTYSGRRARSDDLHQEKHSPSRVSADRHNRA